MPALSIPVASPQLPTPVELPPAIDLPPTIPVNVTGGSGIHGTNMPVVQSGRAKKTTSTSVNDRLRKKSNPLIIVFAAMITLIVIGVGVIAVLWEQSEKGKQQFGNKMVGNWELIPGQSQLERWDFAFHDDRKMQMALGNQLSEGRWKVTSVQGETGYLLIEWPDEAPETMRVRFEGGTMQIQLESVGSFAFRAAVP
ncbi:MAG: hypothetical protein H6822_17845 [Planctomycetaceae bacterium]|nr:hypothetical protein [Planctomycetales bacterium]MCB9924049.1 hypothetical protein [Planctomycetaceae bacterium]